jgi:hypothetical protein
VVKWIVIGVLVLSVFVLIASFLPVVGRLSGLRRAAMKLQSRQADALRLQAGAAELEQSVAALQQRTETVQEHLAAIQAGGGSGARAVPGQ